MQTEIKVRPVILCGGSGTRLWPLSRLGFPKQFLSLTGTESLFQLSAMRLAGLATDGIDVAEPFIVTGEEHRFLALEQMREAQIRLGAAFLEPSGRNTAPALTLAALAATDEGGDPVMVVAPADQTVSDPSTFSRAMQVAIRRAALGEMVILGVPPDHPATGYGYIRAAVPASLPGSDEQDSAKPAAYPVLQFVEKPDLEAARRYLESESYFWNAGIFVLRGSVWLHALEVNRPDILSATRQAWNKRTTDLNLGIPFVRPGKAEFAAVPSESIDYAVMERCPGGELPVTMVPLHAGWSDLGAWNAVWQVLPKDKDGNAHRGDVLTADSRNTLVYASSRLVSLVGVDGLIVIETPDAVLVTDQSCSQDVKAIVSELHASRRDEHLMHRKVHRPWGWYDSIDDGHRFKVKRIQVKPGASLSLQKHHHRAEHWIVVKGTAEVTNGHETLILKENQSTYIPLGAVHRLSNPGTIPLEIIEVQSGSYLAEDDIVRYEDTYGRGER